MAAMRVLVTGGAGFIGSHLVDGLLSDGHEVRVLDNLDDQVHDGFPDYLSRAAEFIHGDVRDGATVERALADVTHLVHLAAAVGVGQSMYQIKRYTSVNALGAAVVLEAASVVRDHLEGVVVASSMSIYGEGLYVCEEDGNTISPRLRPESQINDRRWEIRCPTCEGELAARPTPETKPLYPTSIYAIGKRDHEEMFLAWGGAYSVRTVALRFFNVYGPRQALSNPYTGVAAIFASRLLNNRPPVIFEDGRQSRDFIHVADIVRGIRSALTGNVNGLAINLGTGEAISVLDVARTLNQELGLDIAPAIRGDWRAGDIRHCYADISLARECLGFEPQVSFESGIRELVGWLVRQTPVDRVDEATAELLARGLAR